MAHLKISSRWSLWRSLAALLGVNFATYSKQMSYLKGALKKNETEVKKANSKIALLELELKAANQRISILEGSRTSVVKVESASKNKKERKVGGARNNSMAIKQEPGMDIEAQPAQNLNTDELMSKLNSFLVSAQQAQEQKKTEMPISTLPAFSGYHMPSMYPAIPANPYAQPMQAHQYSGMQNSAMMYPFPAFPRFTPY